MYLSMEFLFEKQIGLVTMNFRYIIFTTPTHDNQQECLKLSNHFSLFGAVGEPTPSYMVVQF